MLSVLTFNICHSGVHATNGLTRVADIIVRSDCDVCAIQEADGTNSCGTCAKLGAEGETKQAVMRNIHRYLQQRSQFEWYCCDQSCILSKFPIELFKAIGVVGHGKLHGSVWIQPTETTRILIYNVHMNYPKFLGDSLRLCTKNVDMLVDEWQVRGGELMALLQDWQERWAGDCPTIVLGDMNTLSHLDDDSHDARSMPFPLTALLAEKGFTDAYRTIHPDAAVSPGHTYCVHLPHYDTSQEVDARLDYVMFHGNSVSATEAIVISDDPWPSDHRALLLRLQISRDTEVLERNRELQLKQRASCCIPDFIDMLECGCKERQHRQHSKKVDCTLL